MYRKFIKRLLDFVLAFIAIIVLSPIILITTILVRIKLGKPVLFLQKRPGLNGEVFNIYKFRTMTNGRDVKGDLLSDEKRLTKFGKFLRSTSIDELPGFINILKGDMSIIGPRPLLVQYLPLYNETQKRRHEVRPGLSGLAQVNGRNAITWEEKFNYDVLYVDNITFIGDMKIIFKTVKNVMLRKGINSDTAATMEYFVGSNTQCNSENDKIEISKNQKNE